MCKEADKGQENIRVQLQPVAEKVAELGTQLLATERELAQARPELWMILQDAGSVTVTPLVGVSVEPATKLHLRQLFRESIVSMLLEMPEHNWQYDFDFGSGNTLSFVSGLSVTDLAHGKMRFDVGVGGIQLPYQINVDEDKVQLEPREREYSQEMKWMLGNLHNMLASQPLTPTQMEAVLGFKNQGRIELEDGLVDRLITRGLPAVFNPDFAQVSIYGRVATEEEFFEWQQFLMRTYRQQRELWWTKDTRVGTYHSVQIKPDLVMQRGLHLRKGEEALIEELLIPFELMGVDEKGLCRKYYCYGDFIPTLPDEPMLFYHPSTLYQYFW